MSYQAYYEVAGCIDVKFRPDNPQGYEFPFLGPSDFVNLHDLAPYLFRSHLTSKQMDIVRGSLAKEVMQPRSFTDWESQVFLTQGPRKVQAFPCGCWFSLARERVEVFVYAYQEVVHRDFMSIAILYAFCNEVSEQKFVDNNKRRGGLLSRILKAFDS